MYSGHLPCQTFGGCPSWEVRESPVRFHCHGVYYESLFSIFFPPNELLVLPSMTVLDGCNSTGRVLMTSLEMIILWSLGGYREQTLGQLHLSLSPSRLESRSGCLTLTPFSLLLWTLETDRPNYACHQDIMASCFFKWHHSWSRKPRQCAEITAQGFS